LEQRNLKYQQANAKFISALNKYNATKNDLENAIIEINSIKAEYLEKISKAESDLNNTLAEIYDAEALLRKLEIEVTSYEIRNGYYIIRAPQDGYIVRAAKQGIGETVKEGEEICNIMPANAQIAVELYIKPMDLPLVYKDCPVRIQFDGWPAIVFAGWPGASVGTYGGKVKVIDYVSSANGKYRLLVVPDENDKPWPQGIRMGSGVLGWTMLKTVLLGYEIWRQFNGFPPEFTGKVTQNKKSDKESKYVGKDNSDE
jgi:multidrug efflux pump subunit AcrA (membrane-fusion protein)